MPFDFGGKKRKRSDDETRHIYLCECGSIRLETRHSRQSFTPEEFVAVLRRIVAENAPKENLPVVQ